MSPRTIHSGVLDKSPVSGPGRGPLSCNKPVWTNSHITFLITSLANYWKNHSLSIGPFVGNVIPLLFNTPSSSIITFLPRSRCVFISWLQSPLAVITVLNCSLLPPRRDAPPCPSAPRGSASPFKGPVLVRLLSTTHPLTAWPRLQAGQLFVCACAHCDPRRGGERRLEVLSRREFLSLESNLALAVSSSLYPGSEGRY